MVENKKSPHFSFLILLQMVGLLFVIIGVWIYNDIIIMPFIRRAMKRPAAQRKISQEPIIGSEAEEKAGNQRIRGECMQSENILNSFSTLNMYK